MYLSGILLIFKNNAKDKHGKNEYTLEEYGLNVEDIRARFSTYIARFLGGDTAKSPSPSPSTSDVAKPEPQPSKPTESVPPTSEAPQTQRSVPVSQPHIQPSQSQPPEPPSSQLQPAIQSTPLQPVVTATSLPPQAKQPEPVKIQPEPVKIQPEPVKIQPEAPVSLSNIELADDECGF